MVAGVGYALGDDCSIATSDDLIARLNSNLCYSRGSMAAALGVFGGALGLGIGLIAGHGEKWEATTPEHLKVGVIPLLRPRGGAGLALVVGF